MTHILCAGCWPSEVAPALVVAMHPIPREDSDQVAEAMDTLFVRVPRPCAFGHCLWARSVGQKVARFKGVEATAPEVHPGGWCQEPCLLGFFLHWHWACQLEPGGSESPPRNFRRQYGAREGKAHPRKCWPRYTFLLESYFYWGSGRNLPMLPWRSRSKSHWLQQGSCQSFVVRSGAGEVGVAVQQP